MPCDVIISDNTDEKWTKTTDSSRLDNIYLPDKSVTHDSFVYMRHDLKYLQIVNV